MSRLGRERVEEEKFILYCDSFFSERSLCGLLNHGDRDRAGGINSVLDNSYLLP